jgi:hypothetical protein
MFFATTLNLFTSYSNFLTSCGKWLFSIQWIKDKKNSYCAKELVIGQSSS